MLYAKLIHYYEKILLFTYIFQKRINNLQIVPFSAILKTFYRPF